MAEQFLNGAEIGSLFEHVRAKGVAQCVGMNIGGKAFGYSNALDDAANAACGKASAAAVENAPDQAPRTR